MTEKIDEIVKSIGKIVVNFNGLEMLVRRLLWNMIDSKNLSIGEAVTKGLDSSQLESLGQRLIKALPMPEDRASRLKDAFSKLEKVRNERNSNAHQMLRIPNEPIDLSDLSRAWPQHYKKVVAHSDGKPIDLCDLRKVNQDCIDLGNEFNRLLDEWVSPNGSSNK